LPLESPDECKSIIANSKLTEGGKELVVNALANYYHFRKVPFSKPIYKRIEQNPFLPQEEEAIDLIKGLTPAQAAFCQFLKESAARAGEAFKVKWTEITNGIVNIIPEKSSKPRQFKPSPKLLSMIYSLPHRSETIWGKSNFHDFACNFFKQRKQIALVLGNPRIKQIHWHTFRHLRASQEYHRTKDIVYIQRLLGHRSIASTLKYIQLGEFANDEFICKVAKSLTEAAALIETGFDYICEMDGVRLFKKRK